MNMKLSITTHLIIIKNICYGEKKKVLVYIQKIYTKKNPSSSYLHTIIKGYKDCNLNINFLKKTVKNYSVNYNINW